jgi:hypothetical protein
MGDLPDLEHCLKDGKNTQIMYLSELKLRLTMNMRANTAVAFFPFELQQKQSIFIAITYRTPAKKCVFTKSNRTATLSQNHHDRSIVAM